MRLATWCFLGGTGLLGVQAGALWLGHWDGTAGFLLGSSALAVCAAFALVRRWENAADRLEFQIRAGAERIAPTGIDEIDRLGDAVQKLCQGCDAALEEAEAEARAERLAAVNRMVGELAHEIRNPLAALRLKAENALNGQADDMGRALTASLEQVARLDALLAKLLLLTRRDPIVPQSVPVASWLTKVIDRTRDRATARRIEMRLHAVDESWPLGHEANDRALEQVLINAIEHSPKGGVVEVGARTEHGRLIVVVQDDGEPVPETDRERVFDPSAVSHAPRAHLGMAVARAALEAQGATIACAEKNGSHLGGARFILEFPWRES